MKHLMFLLCFLACNQPTNYSPPAISDTFQTNTDVQVPIPIAPPNYMGGDRIITCMSGVAVYGGWAWNGNSWYWRKPYCDSTHIGMSFRNSYYDNGIYHEGAWVRSNAPMRTTVINNYRIIQAPSATGVTLVKPLEVPKVAATVAPNVTTPTVTSPTLPLVKTWGTGIASSQKSNIAVKPSGTGVDNRGMVVSGGNSIISAKTASTGSVPSTSKPTVTVSKPAPSTSSGWGSKPATSSTSRSTTTRR